MRADRRHVPVMARLMLLFALLLIVFTLAVGLLYNSLMRRQSIGHYSKSMQRHAYAISQNLAEMIVPAEYEGLDETRFIVSEDTIAPYMALIEQMTNCNVYLVDVQHNVTGILTAWCSGWSARFWPPISSRPSRWVSWARRRPYRPALTATRT